ncbi:MULTISPECIES: winged helix-turn-helix domain-containing protein [Oxalobacteraceae]|jgi:DNA-binding winged helix-turn-helix (wHTH) protein|uniref:winged helix-turn-helix domain-containing protein n=1 Tax=Oxalobacteraceae TaxID=75682 RepID=UPI0010A4993E|nr:MULTISPECIES: winged helix-turn-helix domain-containing protein [Oxalobacteraceae]
MEVTLKVVHRDLFSFLSNAVSSLPRSFKCVSIKWKIELVESELRPADFVTFSDSPSTFLVCASDVETIRSIRVMQNEIHALKSKNLGLPLVLAPVICAVQENAGGARIDDLPDFMSDWIYAPINIQELGRRIISCLVRQRLMTAHLRAGMVTLMPDTRSISCGGKTLRLSPSEFMLADLFFNQFGTIISFDQLIQFFRSKGKSTEASNIRVAIYQLRLKLDMLTKSQISLASVYKKGYCLRSDGGKGATHWDSPYGPQYAMADRKTESWTASMGAQND